MQNSHRDGGGDFLIFVADPRTGRLFRNPSRRRPRSRKDRAVAFLGVMMPTWYTGLRKHVGNMAAEVGVTDTLSTDRTRGPKVSSLDSFRSAFRMSAVSQYCDTAFMRNALRNENGRAH